MKAILGKKLGMTQIFDEKGKFFPVTLILAEANIVTQVKEKSVQIAIPENKKINKPCAGHLSQAGIKSRNLREFPLSGELKIGDKINLDQFEVGQVVNITGLSKGKGFAGTVKRHHFHTGPKTHGSNNYRQPGSIGAQQPQRVVKGKRMGGHLGYDRVTTKNLKIVSIDKENNIIMLNGAVPGVRQSLVSIWSKND